MHTIEATLQLFHGHRHQKKHHFLPQNGKTKIPIFGPNQCFLGSGGKFKEPQSCFAGAQLTICCRVWEPEWVWVFHPPPPLNGNFLPKRGQNMPILSEKKCFLGLGGQFKAPHPISQVSNPRQDVLQGMRPRKWVIQGRPPPKKMAVLCPKKA